MKNAAQQQKEALEAIMAQLSNELTSMGVTPSKRFTKKEGKKSLELYIGGTPTTGCMFGPQVELRAIVYTWFWVEDKEVFSPSLGRWHTKKAHFDSVQESRTYATTYTKSDLEDFRSWVLSSNPNQFIA